MKEGAFECVIVEVDENFDANTFDSEIVNGIEELMLANALISRINDVRIISSM